VQFSTMNDSMRYNWSSIDKDCVWYGFSVVCSCDT